MKVMARKWRERLLIKKKTDGKRKIITKLNKHTTVNLRFRFNLFNEMREQKKNLKMKMLVEIAFYFCFLSAFLFLSFVFWPFIAADVDDHKHTHTQGIEMHK